VVQKGVGIDVPSQKVREDGLLSKLVYIFHLVAYHDHLVQRFLRHVRRNFAPNSIEQHRRVHEHQLLQNLWEKPLRIDDYLLQGVQDTFGGQLHDLTAEVDDPNDLLALLEHSLTEMQETLVEVVDQLVLLEQLRQFLHLHVAHSIDDDRLLVVVLATDPVMIDLFDRLDLFTLEVVLSGASDTWNYYLKCRKAGSSALRLARSYR
jgi:hypothetical protein